MRVINHHTLNTMINQIAISAKLDKQVHDKLVLLQGLTELPKNRIINNSITAAYYITDLYNDVRRGVTDKKEVEPRLRYIAYHLIQGHSDIPEL